MQGFGCGDFLFLGIRFFLLVKDLEFLEKFLDFRLD
jgi:hypothetical protein